MCEMVKYKNVRNGKIQKCAREENVYFQPFLGYIKYMLQGNFQTKNTSNLNNLCHPFDGKNRNISMKFILIFLVT